MKKKLLAGAMALALVGCGQKQADESAASSSPTADTAAESVEGAATPAARSTDEEVPGVSISSAPGVAFDYSYSFRLDDGLISTVQQEHAEACEILGTARCRIVDVRYQLNDEKRVEAQTQFALDPGIARRFGADAIASVEKAEGVLADASVAGEDVGSQIAASQVRSAGATAEVERLEARLKAGGLDKNERAEILAQISSLKGELTDQRASRKAGEARIATTSVVFNYVGSGGLPGIGHRNPFADAGETLMFSGGTALFVLTLGAAVLPWALLVGLLVLVWRSNAVIALRRRLGGKPAPETPGS
ncbi:hypothetical protein BWQ93_06460 [Sphingopyxis sp. QXT-31]|uniref:DUF4349 domain-containing protein n=1 Tax=Sphingopyxis sp. QXT-31 TaxID=1357916 RepID=UPI0009792BB5|nr:DUF4349 domain-containing protein [Sphingopyxis sp. QXT-31]APZ98159.1 hypothetical protein BWQ93_06460 [Sphingopyxis sp. QXT-31]